MYHLTRDRVGNAAGISRPSSLAMAWKTGMDGTVYGQPLVIDGAVIAATENNSVYSLSLSNGAQRWRTHLGSPVRGADLPCGNIDPLGITGTPAYDQVTGSLFVVTETSGGAHTLVALDADTGRVRFSRDLDVGGRDRLAQQQRAALAVGNGRVYVAFGGLYGDCGNYVGYVAGLKTDGSGPVVAYRVPTSREGGIWAASGPAIAADGSVLVAVGNGAATSGPYDGSDSILRLSPDLSSRLDYFAPATWASENASDSDLGSTGPLILSSGMVIAAGKSGTLYLLDGSKLGGIGGQVAEASGCTGFGGMAAGSGSAQDTVFVPCVEGLQRFDVTGRSLRSGWRAGVSGSPVVGGGAVWALDLDRGALDAFDQATGRTLATIDVGAVTRFMSPVLVPGMAVVGTRSEVAAVRITP